MAMIICEIWIERQRHSSDQQSEEIKRLHQACTSSQYLAHIKYTHSHIFICIMIMDLMCSAVLRTIYWKCRATRSTALFFDDSIEHNLKMGVRPIFRCRSYCHTFSQPKIVLFLYSIVSPLSPSVTHVNSVLEHSLCLHFGCFM